MFLRRRVPWQSVDIQVKFYEDRLRGTPPSRELNTRGVAEYSDFEHINGYILHVFVFLCFVLHGCCVGVGAVGWTWWD